MISGLTSSAENGDAWSVNQLLSRPLLDAETESYYSAWRTLNRDRPKDHIPLGMSGSVTFPVAISIDLIRREGERLDYEGDDLEDFTAIVVLMDDYYVEIETKKRGAETQAMLNRSRTKR